MLKATIGPRRILITGGTVGGLGWEAAKQLLQQGHEVVMTLRDEAKARVAVDALSKAVGPPVSSDRIHWVAMDLSSMASVRAAGQQVLQRFPSLDVLLLNAGVFATGSPAPEASQDGFEMTYQVNHLSHFLLVHLLMPSLVASKALGGARVVAVSSELHRRLKEYPPDPSYLHHLMDRTLQQGQGQGQEQHQGSGTSDTRPIWSPVQAYALSKLCNLWFVYKLDRLIQAAGLPVTVEAVTPGWVPTTELGSRGSSWRAWLGRLVMHNILPLLPMTVSRAEGARRLADAAAGPGALLAAPSGSQGVVFGSGRYFSKAAPTPSSPASYDTAKQDELWRLSLAAAGIKADDYLPAGAAK